MRSNIVFFVLLGLLGVFGIGLAVRARTEHQVTAPASSAEPKSSAPSASAAPSGSSSSTASTPAEPARGKGKALGRPLRVTSLGWELSAPVVLANGGLVTKKGSALAKAELDVVVRVGDSMQDVEKSLARGGSDEDGADIAIVPLAGVIAAYERLQALRPSVFLVTAWSRGRDVLSSKQALDKLPPTGEIAVKGSPDSAATALALFALDLAGVAPSRVRLGERSDAKAVIEATTRASITDAERADVVLGTSDASRYMPIVAVAPAGLLDGHPELVTGFVKGWLAGSAELAADASAAARTLSALPDAPEPIALLSRFGETQPVGLAENAELLGLSGRDAVNVESLFQRMWRLSREAKLVAIPAPERAPVHTRAVAALIRSEPSLARPDAPGAVPKDRAKKTAGKPIITRALPAPIDVDDASHEIGFVAGVFHRSQLRVSAQRGNGSDRKLGQDLVGRTLDRYGLDSHRVSGAGTASRPGAAVLIEVLPVP